MATSTRPAYPIPAYLLPGLAAKLAQAYRHGLWCEVGDAALDQIDSDNRADGGDYENAHDHCDANALMADAFRCAVGRLPDPTLQADLDLLNAAFTEARRLSVGVPRLYMITSGSIEISDGCGDGAYSLLGVTSTDPADIGAAIAAQLEVQDLTNTDPAESLHLNIRIRIDRRYVKATGGAL